MTSPGVQLDALVVLAVDADAVGALQIDDGVVVAVADDLGVMAGDGTVVDDDVVLVGAADDQRRAGRAGTRSRRVGGEREHPRGRPRRRALSPSVRIGNRRLRLGHLGRAAIGARPGAAAASSADGLPAAAAVAAPRRRRARSRRGALPRRRPEAGPARARSCARSARAPPAAAGPARTASASGVLADDAATTRVIRERLRDRPAGRPSPPPRRGSGSRPSRRPSPSGPWPPACSASWGGRRPARRPASRRAAPGGSRRSGPRRPRAAAVGDAIFAPLTRTPVKLDEILDEERAVLPHQARVTPRHVTLGQADGVAVEAPDRHLVARERNDGRLTLIVFDGQLEHGKDLESAGLSTLSVVARRVNRP